MIASIGGASLQSLFQGQTQAASGAPTGIAALQAQLATYRRQLAECLDCSSSKTPQGQAEIQQLSAKIGDLQARIENIRDARSSAPPAGISAPAQSSASAQTSSGPSQGSLINVYA